MTFYLIIIVANTNNLVLIIIKLLLEQIIIFKTRIGFINPHPYKQVPNPVYDFKLIVSDDGSPIRFEYTHEDSS